MSNIANIASMKSDIICIYLTNVLNTFEDYRKIMRNSHLIGTEFR